MKTNAFVLLLVAVLALGGGLGGAFAGGVAVGKAQGQKEAPSAFPTGSTSGPGEQSQEQLTQGQSRQELLQQCRQQIARGASQEQLQQCFQQLQVQPGQGVGDRGGLAGTIEKVEGNTVTVNTARGPLSATISADTTVQKIAVGSVSDLKAGLRVTVVGQRGEDGTVTANAVVIAPEGGDDLFGGGFGARQRQGQ